MEPTQYLPIDTTRAKSLASVIFSQIGVNLTWHSGLPDCDQPFQTAFRIRWGRMPRPHLPPALLPMPGYSARRRPRSRYTKSLNRFFRHQHVSAPEVALACVLAHELAHVMQALDRHSNSGILKAI